MGSWLQDVRKPSIHCIKIEVPVEPVVGSMWQTMTFLLEGLHAPILKFFKRGSVTTGVMSTKSLLF